MKRKLQIIISASAASVLAFSALGEDTLITKTDKPDYTRDHIPSSRRADRLNGAAKASDILGMTVKNEQDEKLGKVEDLAVDVESGRIIQVILSTGGFIGIGETMSAVPPGALHYDAIAKVIHLDANKEKLKGAPEFMMAKWAEDSDSNHLSEIYRYYGEEPAFVFIQRDGVVEGQRTADGKRDTDRVLSKGQYLIPVSRLSQVQKASKLIMDTPVQNLQEEKLGKVEDILLDLPSGRIVAIIVSSGGFLGMGDEYSAVPPTALRFTADRATLQLDTTKEMLSSAPHFKADHWPDYAQPGNAEGVYRAYHVQPYFSTNTVSAADNTERNVRDRENQTLTPLDQGNSKADVAISAQIRKEIIAGKNVSLNARNVKIITRDGRVTLRGPVNTMEEKRFINEIADRIASSENVDDQLDVKRATDSN